MANERISVQKRKYILTALCEGVAINSVCRTFSVGKNAVLRLIQETGEACEAWHDEHFTHLSVARVEIDETWAYVYKHKEKMGLEEARDHPERGDCWLFAALDADSKAILSWRTGKRTMTGLRFAADLARRIVGEVQITSDMFQGYTKGLPKIFEGRAHYVQEVKTFGQTFEPGHQWVTKKTNPLVRVKRTTVCGAPNKALATVSHIERFFLTVRQGNKRTARKTLAYSKSWTNHAFASSLQIFVYNMCRKHESLKVTPAMALGVTDHRWTVEEVVEMTDVYLKAKEDAAFERAFTKSQFSDKPQRHIPPPIKIASSHVEPFPVKKEPPERWLLPRD